ncbi:alanyl-tRNA editing protein [Photobacterium sp. R1]
MTTRLYMTTSELTGTAQIIRCDADETGYIAELDATLFHPQGGGQPSDLGELENEPGVKATVLQVKEVDGVILHWLDVPLPPGTVMMRVNQAVRQHHAALHSVGHVIGNIGQQYGWKPVKAHHWPEECRIEFMPESNCSELEAAEIEKTLSDLIAQGLTSKIYTDEKGFRWVGFGELSPWPCGGTHLKSLSEVNGKVLATVKVKKSKLIVKYSIEASNIGEKE